MKRILIYGFGNPGRQDDGMGILLVERLENWAEENQIKTVSFDSNYQLNIEDALTISEYKLVIFVDASIEDIESIKLSRVVPNQKTEFTMHAMTPGFVLHLCQSLYRKYPDTYLLHIKGYQFDFLGDLTGQAEKNLIEAVDLLKGIITNSNNPLESLEKHALLQKKTKIKIS